MHKKKPGKNTVTKIKLKGQNIELMDCSHLIANNPKNEVVVDPPERSAFKIYLGLEDILRKEYEENLIKNK